MAKRVAKRVARVSDSQWEILLEFLERNPSLARGYNNSARGRSTAALLWQEVADLLNAEGSGTSKTPKDWSIYVSNYKSKLKKTVADINKDIGGTGGGPPSQNALSDVEIRFLGILGPGFGEAAPNVSVNPFPAPQASTSGAVHQDIVVEVAEQEELIHVFEPQPAVLEPPASPIPAREDRIPEPAATPEVRIPEPHLNPNEAQALPRRNRGRRYRSRPLAPLDEARRILAQVEMQRAQADAASAQALQLIGQNIGRIADLFERYLFNN